MLSGPAWRPALRSARYCWTDRPPGTSTHTTSSMSAGSTPERWASSLSTHRRTGRRRAGRTGRRCACRRGVRTAPTMTVSRTLPLLRSDLLRGRGRNRPRPENTGLRFAAKAALGPRPSRRWRKLPGWARASLPSASAKVAVAPSLSSALLCDSATAARRPAAAANRSTNASMTSALLHPGHQAELVRLGGVDHIGEQHKALGLLQTDEFGQQPGAAEVDRQTRAWRRSGRDLDSGVATTRSQPSAQVPAGADRDAGRPWQWSAPSGCAAPTRHRSSRRVEASPRMNPPPVPILGTGAERAAGAGEHHRADRVVVYRGRLGQRRGERRATVRRRWHSCGAAGSRVRRAHPVPIPESAPPALTGTPARSRHSPRSAANSSALQPEFPQDRRRCAPPVRVPHPFPAPDR